MNSSVNINVYAGPAVSLIFAAAFFGAWLFQRQRGYVLLFSVTFIAFALAALSQITRIPADSGSNALVSGGLYTFAVLCLIEGVMARMNVVRGETVLFVIAAVIMALLYYYYYVDRQVIMRIYAQNFGYGLMFVVAAVAMGRSSLTRGIDKVIFWLFLIFGLHFFPRTILTLAMSGEYNALVQNGGGSSVQVTREIYARSPFWQILNFSLLISSVLVSLALLAAVAADVIEDLTREGGIDALTGLANRRGFHRRVKAIAPDPARMSVSVIYCDIDHFKSINDTYGHAAGDRVLQQFAQLIEGEVRPQDVASRFGGEEFVILLLQANLSGAAHFAERLRQEVELTRFSGLPQHVGVTASFGVAQWRPGEDLLEAMHRADRMVYEAKHAGRNCVASDPPSGVAVPEDPDASA